MKWWEKKELKGKEVGEGGVVAEGERQKSIKTDTNNVSWNLV